MSKVSKHFNRSEFACSDGCGFDAVDVELLEVLEDVREHFNTPLIILSGCRCETHNKSVGGADDRLHVRGKGADIRLRGASPQEVHRYLNNKYPDKYGVGLYCTWVHIDVRANKARWYT